MAGLLAATAPIANASTVADDASDLGQPLATAPTTAAAGGGTPPSAALAGATPRASAAPTPALTSGLYVGLTGMSDYRYDGMSESNRAPTWQLTLHEFRSDGLYAGMVLTPVDFEDTPRTPLEIDLYGGKHFQVFGSDLNLGLLYTFYPGKLSPGPSFNFGELQAEFSHTFSRLTLKTKVAWSPHYSGDTGQAWYGRETASYALTSWLALGGHLGRLWIPMGQSRTFYDVGATATWRRLTFDLRYGGTNLQPSQCFSTNWCAPGAWASITYRLNP
jgi:uncharacterized protein (TIGR02001 family)